MNPYQSPTTLTPHSGIGNVALSRLGPGMIAVILGFAVLVGFLGMVVPSVRAATIPRFGWIGLILCMNPLIFLLPWLWIPTRPALLASASMVVLLGVINGMQLLYTGTVAEVTNEFADRLHTSWLWSVLPFIAAGIYLFGYALRMPATQLDAIKNKQTRAPEVRSDTTEES